ncbi:cysteine dioxygenase type I [Nadsonia fulvescens var. elongata DSM 6958]|uniref:Cysteine dioxygenase n=1 Tax=Nadsonia fulvescens var. elongata DSM 6958 TaxID=857566 RepID=A0A1E3PFU2_9ASCO|nr:cysteine dioxygenase type I [Nadsonia fulvescens var. elongata DSM 6958]
MMSPPSIALEKSFSPSASASTSSSGFSRCGSQPLVIKTQFDRLVDDLRAILGPASGIDSESVDVDSLINLMREYTSQIAEWAPFALSDPSRNYTRNGIDEVNAKANLLILVWNPGKGSMVHDHANAHCIMKVLQGELVEELYEWPEGTNGHDVASLPLHMKKQTNLPLDQVAYISDKIGLHRIRNPSPDKIAVSLHLYTPPWAAKFGCRIFDDRTGKSSKADMSRLYSYRGKLLNYSQGGTSHTC